MAPKKTKPKSDVQLSLRRAVYRPVAKYREWVQQAVTYENSQVPTSLCNAHYILLMKSESDAYVVGVYNTKKQAMVVQEIEEKKHRGLYRGVILRGELNKKCSQLPRRHQKQPSNAEQNYYEVEISGFLFEQLYEQQRNLTNGTVYIQASGRCENDALDEIQELINSIKITSVDPVG